ncbi:MlaD family protein [Nocardia sp. NPDC127526]|uniref:MlaD family protein n=1 Tax=Nocardia sp. NPDC127526 TaxID=3345393 RepID=UPI0036381985
MRSPRLTAGIAIAAAVLALGGCGFDPSAGPVPGASVSGPTYRVHIELASALNLPTGAKVMANGALVGTVSAVTVVDPSAAAPGHIRLDVDIADRVRLPATTTAQLRQNTVLGDIFVGLVTPPDGFGTLLQPEGTIALARTRPALQIEDLMAAASTFISGGALHTMQDIVDRANAVLPQDPAETTRIAATIASDMRDVSGNLATLDAFLSAVETDIGAVLDNRAALGELLTEEGTAIITANARSLVDTTGLIGSLGVISHAIAWLEPLVRAGDSAAKAIVPLLFTAQPFDLDAASNLSSAVALVRDRLVPFLQRGPKVEITHVGIEGAAGDETAALAATLRMIGMVR